MRVAVIGTGKMGSWFAKALLAGHELAVYDSNPSKAASLEGVKVLMEVRHMGAFNPDFVINAVNLQNTIAAFEQVMPYLSAHCIICDIASIKGRLPEYYEKQPFRFVSLHPMFGPTFADMSALQDETVIIMEESNGEGARFFENFFEGLKARIFRCSFIKHDEMMAYSLTLPFVSSMAFAACVDGSAVPGTTFAKHMSVARGLLSEDDHLLAEILFNPHSVAQIERITARLEHLKHIIKDRDSEELKRFLVRLRENLP